MTPLSSMPPVTPMSRCSRFVCWLLLCLFAAGCSGRGVGVAGIRPGDLLLPNGDVVADGFLNRRAMAAEYILIGERHDNPLHHQVQARIIGLLAPMRPVVGLEMLPATSNPVLERFNRGEISVDALPEAVDWNNAWGWDFSLYRPVFAVLAGEKVPVYGLNVPNTLIKALRQKGSEGLSREERGLLPRPVLFPSQARREELAKIFNMHAAMRRKDSAAPVDPRASFERFVLIQSIWDSSMAEQAARLRKEHGAPVIVLAGGGHVEHGQGIAERLESLDPGARVLVVSPAASPDREDLRGADYYYYSPAIPSSPIPPTRP